MTLTPEAREIVRQATVEALSRRLTLDEIYEEIARYVVEAETEEDARAVGYFLGRVDGISRALLAGVASPVAEAPPAPEEQTS